MPWMPYQNDGWSGFYNTDTGEVSATDPSVAPITSWDQLRSKLNQSTGGALTLDQVRALAGDTPAGSIEVGTGGYRLYRPGETLAQQLNPGVDFGGYNGIVGAEYVPDYAAKRRAADTGGGLLEMGTNMVLGSMLAGAAGFGPMGQTYNPGAVIDAATTANIPADIAGAPGYDWNSMNIEVPESVPSVPDTTTLEQMFNSPSAANAATAAANTATSGAPGMSFIDEIKTLASGADESMFLPDTTGLPFSPGEGGSTLLKDYIASGGTPGYAGTLDQLMTTLGGVGSKVGDISKIAKVLGLSGGSALSGKSLGDLFSGKLSMDDFSIGDALKAGGGLYSAYAANELADKQSDLAKYVIDNADPYRNFRKETEIPFLKSLMDQQATQSGRSGEMFDLTKKYGQETPEQSALRNEALATLRDKSKTDPLYNKFNEFATIDPTASGMIDEGRALLNKDVDRSDYDYYENRLRQSYDDPLAVYNSAEMQGLNNIFRNQIERRDAAAGRNSQYGSRAVEMQGNFLKDLGNYRTGLNSTLNNVGGYLNTMRSGNTTAGTALGTVGNAVQAGRNDLAKNYGSMYNNVAGTNISTGNAMGNILNQNQGFNRDLASLYGNMYSNTNSNATSLANAAKPGGNPAAGTSDYGNIMTTSNTLGSQWASPILGSLGSIFGNSRS